MVEGFCVKGTVRGRMSIEESVVAASSAVEESLVVGDDSVFVGNTAVILSSLAIV